MFHTFRGWDYFAKLNPVGWKALRWEFQHLWSVDLNGEPLEIVTSNLAAIRSVCRRRKWMEMDVPWRTEGLMGPTSKVAGSWNSKVSAFKKGSWWNAKIRFFRTSGNLNQSSQIRLRSQRKLQRSIYIYIIYIYILFIYILLYILYHICSHVPESKAKNLSRGPSHSGTPSDGMLMMSRRRLLSTDSEISSTCPTEIRGFQFQGTLW